MHVAGLAFFQSAPAAGSSYLGVIIVAAMVVLVLAIKQIVAGQSRFWFVVIGTFGVGVSLGLPSATNAVSLSRAILLMPPCNSTSTSSVTPAGVARVTGEFQRVDADAYFKRTGS